MTERDDKTRAEAQARAVPIEEQCEATLRHYEHVATVAHEWSNQVPQAIRAWYAAKATALSADARIDGLIERLEDSDEKLSPVVIEEIRQAVMRSTAKWTPFYVKKLDQVFALAQSATTGSATERTGWVACSDRMPGKGEEVLVRGWGEAKKHYMFEFAERRRGSDGTHFWGSTRDLQYPKQTLWFEPVDWMLLPVPSALDGMASKP